MFVHDQQSHLKMDELSGQLVDFAELAYTLDPQVPVEADTAVYIGSHLHPTLKTKIQTKYYNVYSHIPYQKFSKFFLVHLQRVHIYVKNDVEIKKTCHYKKLLIPSFQNTHKKKIFLSIFNFLS